MSQTRIVHAGNLDYEHDYDQDIQRQSHKESGYGVASVRALDLQGWAQLERDAFHIALAYVQDELIAVNAY